MLSRWLQRGSIGQMLAPDPNMKEVEEIAEQSEFKGGIWSYIAPDPNFVSPAGKEGEQQNEEIDFEQHQNQSQSQAKAINSHSHSHRLHYTHMTPIKKEQSSEPSTTTPYDDTKVERLVMSAAKDLASCVASPPVIWDDHKKFFNFCASSTSLSDKQLRRIKKMLKKDTSLANCRASKMGYLVPDGFTPLHAAALHGNYEVAAILIDLEYIYDDDDEKKKKNSNHNNNGKHNSNHESRHEETFVISLDARDVQGRTALHIASEQGHLNLVKLLKTKMLERNNELPIGENAPIDLTGRTPLGWAAMSSEIKACRNREELRIELFSPGDKSVFGKKTPALDRTGGKRINNNSDEMALGYGFAEMPGYRIEMEDAICHAFPLSFESKSGKETMEVGFFGVFDGHGDGGLASNYVADHIVQCLTSTQEWNEFDGDSKTLGTALSKACSDIDVDLKAMFANGNIVRNGGSTGIMALVTPQEIIIGNVGDSRCILVQKETKCNDLSEQFEKSASISDKEDGFVVKGLSNDHKPNLPEEKSRIEKAGLEVFEETFPSGENDELTSIWKIKRSAMEKIAVSRAFGDFDYKANEDLTVEEQAIVCVPEIQIQKRDNYADMYLVLACDGVFDVMSNDEVGKFVGAKAKEYKETYNSNASLEMLPQIGDDLLRHCLDLGSTDNMSVLIVALPTRSGAAIDSAPRKLHFADV